MDVQQELGEPADRNVVHGLNSTVVESYHGVDQKNNLIATDACQPITFVTGVRLS